MTARSVTDCAPATVHKRARARRTHARTHARPQGWMFVESFRPLRVRDQVQGSALGLVLGPQPGSSCAGPRACKRMSSTAIFMSVWHMLSPKPRTCATCASCNYPQCWVWPLTVCAYAARQMSTQEHIALKIGPTKVARRGQQETARCHAAAAARTHARKHTHTHRHETTHARAHTHTHTNAHRHRHRHRHIDT